MYLEERPEGAAAHQRLIFFALTCLTGLVAAVVFVGFPKLDLLISNFFYRGHHHFLLSTPSLGHIIRQGFELIFLVACIVAVAGILLSIFKRHQLLGLGFPHWLFLALALALGPGLVANTILKDHWGRARPDQSQQFGGKRSFTPALVRSDQCTSNCSFVCGEAASIYTVCFAFAFLIRRRRRQLIVLGIAAGTLAGLIRIAGGGHYFSDVVFAGVFMALVVQGVHWLVFELGERRLAEAGPLHMRLHLAGRAMGAGLRRIWRRARQTHPATT